MQLGMLMFLKHETVKYPFFYYQVMKKLTSFVIVLTLTLGVMLASTATSMGLLMAFAQSNQTRATSSSSVAASLSGSPTRISKIKITSPTRDQELPVGKDLTVYGISIDNATSNDCKVSVIVNKVRPYQPATAIGPGGAADYSKWKFDIISKYTTIKPGENRITSKYECANNPNANSFSSVNVTGVSGAATAASPPSTANQTNSSSSSSSPPTPASSTAGANQTAAKQQTANNTGGSSNSTANPLANIPVIGKLFGG
jgi:hypothetical protein